MLSPSPRHTPADLALWREHEAADLIHGRRPQLAAKVERSIEAIREFVAAGPCYCGVSWGKDSVCLAHLTAISGCRVPFVRFRSPEDKYPHDDDVRDAFLAVWPCDYRELVVAWPQRGAADWRQRSALAAETFGCDRYLIGLRAEESGGRRASLAMLGLSTARSCRPLGWWTTADVFGYLAVCGLPVHPSYAMTGGGRWPRESIRVSGLGGSPATTRGRAEWESEYYGDMLRRLA